MKTQVKTIAIIIILSIIASGNLAFARLGETESELVKRYGQMVPWEKSIEYPGAEQKRFLFKHLGIIVYLLNGQSVYEAFFRVGKDSSERQLYQTDIDNILGANARGYEWKPIKRVRRGDGQELVASEANQTFVRGWLLQDGSHAMYSRGLDADGHFVDSLEVFTKAWDEHLAALARKQKAEILKQSGL